MTHTGHELGAAHHEMKNVVIEVEQFTQAARAALAFAARTEAVFLEVSAFAVTTFPIALEAARSEIIRTFKAALAAFAVVLAERTLFGEILSILAPIIHVKPAFLCAAPRLARGVFQRGRS